MKLEIMVLHWAKRRRPDPIREVEKVTLEGFRPVRAHLCTMYVVFKDGEKVTLNAQVNQNPVTGAFSVNGLDAHGNQVAVSVLEFDHE